jgi:hypothetical protein
MPKPTGTALIKLSLRQIMKDKSLLFVPVLTGLLTFFTATVFLGLYAWFFLAGGNNSHWVTFQETGELDPITNWFSIAWLVVVFGVSATITTFARATMVAAAMQRLDGGDPTVGSSFGIARQHGKTLFVYVGIQTALETVLARVRGSLDSGARLAGTVLSRMGLAGMSAFNIAYKYASFLSIPVILEEHVGFKDSIMRSAKLVTEKFGTAFRTVAAASVYRLAVIVIAFVPLIATLAYAASLGEDIASPDLGGGFLAGLGMFSVAWIVLALMSSALIFPVIDAYTSVLIYRYAAGLPIEGVDPAVIAAALPTPEQSPVVPPAQQ